ncbi:SAM-dependent methyltransferase [Bacterioplanes sanyensis]|uniref:SAM-dependent methyltransferase n=1 Tax=Bacterioplanes sanyensis TaxID=1249553 RepID=A0A222FHH4_9GAMM|nr:class I SAM-dependent methyltransferase [Bacterioplanes sanyensis]ASP38438.1 SAM-dependent methyltransferase [Bacterioplanes sanyensis]
MEELIAQYTGADEDSRLTRQYIAQIEYDTTMHVLKPYWKAGKKLCELGAATGRYALAFAEQGCDVTAVELAPEQVELMRQQAKERQLTLTMYEGDACDVSFIGDASQDVCLMLGPMYHLTTVEQRNQAIAEAKRILKPGGILAVAYISRFFVAGLFAKHWPRLMTPAVLNELLQQGTVSATEADSFFRVGYFSTPAEAEGWVTQVGFRLENHVATDGYVRYLAESVNHFSPEQYQAWLQQHLQHCHESSLLGSSNHGLVIARKSA